MSTGYRDAFQAIESMYGDTSVEPEETAERLLALKFEIEERLETLESDGVDVDSLIMAESPLD